MLPVKKTVIEISPELLQRLSQLVSQLINGQASEIPPTLGDQIPLVDLLRSLGENARTTEEPSSAPRPATLPALLPSHQEASLKALPGPSTEKPRGIEAPQPKLLNEEAESAPSSRTFASLKGQTGEGDAAQTPPPQGISAILASTATLPEKWAQVEAYTRACRRNRKQAAAEEREAYREVLVLSEQADMGGKASPDFLGKVRKAVDLQEHLDRAEAQWHELQKQEEKRKALKLEQLKKIHELEEIREQLHLLEVAHASNTTTQKTSEMPPRGPGPTAMACRDARKPCGPMDGPRVELRYKRYCQVCNLTGVSRTTNCPNYFLHGKFQSGDFPRYRY